MNGSWQFEGGAGVDEQISDPNLRNQRVVWLTGGTQPQRLADRIYTAAKQTRETSSWYKMRYSRHVMQFLGHWQASPVPLVFRLWQTVKPTQRPPTRGVSPAHAVHVDACTDTSMQGSHAGG